MSVTGWFAVACLVITAAVIVGKFIAARRRGDVDSVRSYIKLERYRLILCGCATALALPSWLSLLAGSMAYAIGLAAVFTIVLTILIINAVRTGPDRNPKP